MQYPASHRLLYFMRRDLLRFFCNNMISATIWRRLILPVAMFSALFTPIKLAAEDLQPLFFVNLSTENGLSSNVTSTIVQDRYGFIWIGTLDGLSRFDGYKMHHFQSRKGDHSLSFSNITALLEDGDKLWVGTWDGLNIIDIKSFRTEEIDTGAARVIRALYKDRGGDVWVGTSEGVMIIDKERKAIRRITASDSNLSHNMIRSFYQSADGDMWIGTYDGLNRYSNGEITTYNLKGDYKPLLENNLIVSIAPFYGNADSMI